MKNTANVFKIILPLLGSGKATIPLVALLLLSFAGTALAQGTVFTYQGSVLDHGTNFIGIGQFKFALVTSTNAASQATATAIMGGSSPYEFVQNFNITSGGSGYVNPPAVTITGGGGSGALAQATILGGVVTGITIINPGSGYTSTPTVTIAAPPANISYTTYWSNDGTSGAGSQPSAAVSVPVSNGLFTVGLGDTSLANMIGLPADLFQQQPDLHLRIWFNDGLNGFAALHPAQRLTPSPYALYAPTAGSATIVTGPVAASQITGTLASSNIGVGTIASTNLAAGAAAANLAASGQSAVPGGGMIFSTNSNDGNLVNAGYVKVGWVDLGDMWEQRTSGAAPSARSGHTAVWIGGEMIVWGGNSNSVYFNSGGRYNPTANSWMAVTTSGAPVARTYHTAVWTGSEMIVWGGSDLSGRLITGARYNPTANSWTAVATNGAPTARLDPTVVWTGSEMIVWGGSSLPGSDFLNTGARYNPTANSWTAVTTSGAPVARTYHTAVWTGSEMIVWGGQGGGSRNDGGRYNPTANSWTAVTTSGAPTGRYEHTAVWTGSKMIVWGGYGPTGRTNDGGIYDPTVNNWTSVATTGAPTGRTGHTAVWTGNEMIVWGGNTSPGSGFLNTGGGYDPTANSWMAVNAGRAPAARNGHTAEWTGSEMIVWGGVNVEGATSHYLNDTFSYTTSRGLYLYQRP